MNDYIKDYWQISRFSEDLLKAKESYLINSLDAYQVKKQSQFVMFSEEQLSQVMSKIGDLRAQIICGAGISEQVNLLSDIENVLVLTGSK